MSGGADDRRTRQRKLVRKALFLTALFLLMVLALPACVSVQKTGEAEAGATTGDHERVVSLRTRNGEIFINGEFRGTASVVLHLPPGTHEIEIKLDGYHTWSRELTVVAGNDTRVSATLKPE